MKKKLLYTLPISDIVSHLKAITYEKQYPQIVGASAGVLFWKT